MIVLYHPRAAERRFRIPLSVLTLAATLHREHEVRIVDGDLSPDPVGELRRHLQASGGNALLGVSVMPGPQLSRAIPHCRTLKAEFPDVPIIWGGWFPSLHADVCLKASYVDYVMRGRCENAFPVLVRRLLEGGSLDDVPHLSWKLPDGTFRHNPEGPLPLPDDLPPLPFHLVPVARYNQRTWLGERTTGYHSSYGCPLRCGFCAVAAQFNGRWLGQSVPRMMVDLEQLFATGSNAIEFFDNNFFVQEERVRQFSETVRGRGIAWWGEGTIDGLLAYRDETLRAMRASGCRMIFFGAESGSEAALELMNKNGLKPSSTLELARRFRKFDIVPEFSFVLGTPMAPRDDIEASIRLILKLKEANPVCEIILYVYSPEPFQRAEMWQAAVQEGFSLPETLEQWEEKRDLMLNLRRMKQTPWLDERDVRRIYDFEAVLGSYYPGVSDIDLGPRARRILKVLAAPRWHLRRYHAPEGLKLALRAFRHHRVEEEGL